MIFSTKLDPESTRIPVACEKKQKNLETEILWEIWRKRKLFTHSTLSDHEIKVWIFNFPILDSILIPKKSWKVGHFHCASYIIHSIELDPSLPQNVEIYVELGQQVLVTGREHRHTEQQRWNESNGCERYDALGKFIFFLGVDQGKVVD